MAMYRKLGKASKPRKALLRNQVTNLLYEGKIITTEARAKEVVKIAEHLIALGVREKDNTEKVTVSVKNAKKDANGKRVKEVVDGKNVVVYETTTKEVTKDLASRVHARRQMRKMLYTVTEVPAEVKGKKIARLMDKRDGSMVHPVMVEGKVQYREYQDQQGNKRTATDIRCENFVMLGSRDGEDRGGRGESEPQAPAAASAGYDDDIPF